MVITWLIGFIGKNSQKLLKWKYFFVNKSNFMDQSKKDTKKVLKKDHVLKAKAT